MPRQKELKIEIKLIKDKENAILTSEPAQPNDVTSFYKCDLKEGMILHCDYEGMGMARGWLEVHPNYFMNGWIDLNTVITERVY